MRRRRDTAECLGATPELLRIEIDNIFKEFLADSEKVEYIFPPDLNNLQRKYIHKKAHDLNLSSKSHGKEPDRRLHIKKKERQTASKTFDLRLSMRIVDEIKRFTESYAAVPEQKRGFQENFEEDRVYHNRFYDGKPEVPLQTQYTNHIRNIRISLPIFEKREIVLNAIATNQITIISSETGSGKTTQVPQYILEDCCQKRLPCKIICTQPRRISSVAAAERVSFERNDELGNSVGYHIKLESTIGRHTNLVYCTVGVFLRTLMANDKCLKSITHIIIDEIHERDKLSDFLLICIRQHLPLYRHLKIIIMSATLNAEKFKDYFKSGVILSIPGRLFPIQTYFLDDILNMTGYSTPKMKEAEFKLKLKKLSDQSLQPSESNSTNKQDSASNNIEEALVDPEVDEALNDYLNFSENYDYRVHYEEATAQLEMYFLTEGISVDYKHSQSGLTALMIAAYLGDLEFVSRLCNMGANVDLCCNVNRTAFDYAKINNQIEVLALLDHTRGQKQSTQKNGQKEDNKDKELPMQLYDMTTPDDFIDYDLIVTVICYIYKMEVEGSILVFLPGYDEIMQCNDRIAESPLDPDSYRIFFLHSNMNIRDQRDVFQKLPNQQRKIILSTNIAETSITIEDVVFVVDVGRVKEKVFDSYNKLSSLQTQRISKACAKQREGRAGRVRPGFCFRLYSMQRYTYMDEERVPEILRVSLEELCLHAKILAPEDMNIYSFLSLAPDAPTTNSVKVAIEHLQSLGALDEDEDLTMLGGYLGKLTIEPRLGKMLIYGCIFRCLEPILTLAAAMAQKDPFQLPPQANLKAQVGQKRKEMSENVLSDHLIYLKVYQKWQEATVGGNSRSFCYDHFISEATMNSILDTRRQIHGQLKSAGFIPNDVDVNANANSWGVVKAVMSTSFYPNVAYPVEKGLGLATRNEKKVNLHNTSVCSKRLNRYWLIYDEMVKNRLNFLIRGATVVGPFTVAMMCGVNVIYPDSQSVCIDNYIAFTFQDIAFTGFRRAIENLIYNTLLNPKRRFTRSENEVVKTLRTVIDIDESSWGWDEPECVGTKSKFVRKEDLKSSSSWRNKSNSAQRNGRGGRYRNQEYTKMTRGPPPPNHFENRSSGSTSRQNVSYQNRTFNRQNVEPRNNIKRSEQYPEYPDNPLFMFINVLNKRQMDVAQSRNKWTFSTWTEQKVLHFYNRGKTILLIFYVSEISCFMGVAEFTGISMEGQFGKSQAHLEWIYSLPLLKDNVSNLRNPYNHNKPVHDAVDGTVIQQRVGEQLCHIYALLN